MIGRGDTRMETAAVEEQDNMVGPLFSLTAIKMAKGVLAIQA